MKLEFNSIDELRDFISFAAELCNPAPTSAVQYTSGGLSVRYEGDAVHNIETKHYADGSSATGVAPLPDAPPVPDAHLTTEERAAALAQATPPGRVDRVAVAAQEQAQDQAEPPKRKRRTKAEIEAARAADAATPPTQDAAPSDAQAVAATSPIAGANPFDTSTSNDAAAVGALTEAPAGTTGTLAALGEVVADMTREAVEGQGADVDPQAYIALRVAELGGTFDPREHMKKCVEFIGALGKAKYDEAFALAGTSRAVASYTPADCAKHIAALEYLQIAG